jgi:hypothetical protein
LCEQALTAEQHLGSTADAHLAMLASQLRWAVATNAVAHREAADHALDASRHARADNLPGVAAFNLAGASNNLGFLDPATALPLATEGLALARQTGAPLAISFNLVSLAQVLASDDPDQARALLDESVQLEATLGFESPSQLSAIVFAAAFLAAWPTALHATSRLLHHQLRSGTATTPTFLAGILNLAARGLAEDRPEPAAVIQGAVAVVLRGITPRGAGPDTRPSEQPGTIIEFVAGARRDATQLIVAALGEPRMRELRAEGAALTEDQAYTYARAHIDEYLATIGETQGG